MRPAQKIFLSYRRSDAAFHASAIHERLAEALGADHVFFDVDNIPAGRDFRNYLQQAIANCDVCLVVIGDHWLLASDDDGKRRLDDPRDFVRIEIEAALERGIPVIPLLVDGASVPAAATLPKSLADLSYRQGLSVRPGRDFKNDMNALIGQIRALAGEELLTTHATNVSHLAAGDEVAIPLGISPEDNARRIALIRKQATEQRLSVDEERELQQLQSRIDAQFAAHDQKLLNHLEKIEAIVDQTLSQPRPKP